MLLCYGTVRAESKSVVTRIWQEMIAAFPSRSVDQIDHMKLQEGSRK